MAPRITARDRNTMKKPVTTFGRIVKPDPSPKIKLRLPPRAVNHLPRPTTPLLPPAVFDGTFELPTTPTKQIMSPPQTPMAPLKPPSGKRRFSVANAEEEVTLETPHSRLLEILTTADPFNKNNMLQPVTPPQTQRPHCHLRKLGLAVFTTTPKKEKHGTASNLLIHRTEADPSIFARLTSLIGRGRRAGGSPSYTFKRGRSRVRYEYMSSQDEEYQAVDERPRKRRREGSPLSSEETASLKEMLYRPSHIPEGIDFDI